MSAILKVVQGSPEWHAHRASHRNASETAAVLGVSPWLTPYQLWLQRTGRQAPSVNPAMLRGTRLEPSARAAYEALTGNVMEPLVLIEGDYSASLDGITLDGSLIVEIKCPMKGQESELWKQAAAGKLPEHYQWQVQHQLMVSSASLAHVYVSDGETGVLVEQRPREGDWKIIRDGWDAFINLVKADREPPLTDRDTVIRIDAEWIAAAQLFLSAKRLAEDAAENLDSAKAALIALAAHPSEKGAGVAVSRYWKAGAIEYKRVPSLARLDLESYRSPPREEVRVIVSK